jgi:hypothetical protein
MEVVGGFHTLPKDIVENSVNINGGGERFLYLPPEAKIWLEIKYNHKEGENVGSVFPTCTGLTVHPVAFGFLASPYRLHP